MTAGIGSEEKIKSVYASLRASEKKVADYVLSRMDAVAGLSIAELSRRAGVSQPTVIRFVRALGFSGYRRFKFALLEERRNGAPEAAFEPLDGFDLRPWDRLEDIPLKTVRVSKSVLDDTLKSVSPAAYRQAVAYLAAARIIDIYCVENSMAPASDLLNKLIYLGLQCRLHTDGYLQQISACHLSPADAAVAFSYSGSSADTVKALKQAKKSGAKTIAVTNVRDSVIAGSADVCILAGGRRNVIYGNAIFSRVSQLAVVDMLYMGVILSDYRRFSAELDKSGALIRDRGYEAPEKKK